MTAHVSVIIPTHNSLPYLMRSLQSVRQQSIGRENIELIVVDDCSTDDTMSALLEFASEWPAMQVLQLESNSGSGGAPRNRGLDIATGRYVFLLDSDDYLAPDALEHLVAMADKNGTDIVLPRMEGVGSRHVPQTMFTHDQPRTDLFQSRVNWTLGPQKLYRRSLLERLALRFPEDMRYASDQPFVTRAYLGANGISVLASRTCLYVTHRDDGTNLTTLATPARRLRALEIMIDLVTNELAPGSQRDFLLRRQFNVDVMTSLRALPSDGSAADDALVKRLADLLRPHYSDAISSTLPCIDRVCIDRLLAQDLDGLALVLAREATTPPPEIIIEGNRAYELWPLFRDDRGVPDSCYDVTERVRIDHYLKRVSWEKGTLEVEGSAGLRSVESPYTVNLVLRMRDANTVLIVPTEHADKDSLGSARSDSMFISRIDPTTFLDGAPLPPGLWDAYVRIQAGEFQKEARIGSHRSEHIRDAPVSCRVGEVSSSEIATVYFTHPFGNLTLDMGCTRHTIGSLLVQPARWDSSSTPAALISGSLGLLNIPQPCLFLRLSHEGGDSHKIAALLEETAGRTSFEARIPLRTALAGAALSDGDWTAHVQLELGKHSAQADIPTGDGLPTIRWWRGLRPMHAKSISKPDETLRLGIKPVDMLHAVKRRLSR